LSAVLHAGWNAAVKASRDPPDLFWSGLPPLSAWP
jgi:hypothetical protein